MLTRLILGTLLVVIAGFLGQFMLVKFLVVGGFFALAMWSFKEAHYDSLETTMGRLYGAIGGLAVIAFFIIPAIKKALEGTLSALSSGGGMLFLLVVAYMIWGNK
ncbi:TPA: hypothetical protein ACTZ5V_003920 [Bacillus cereus]